MARCPSCEDALSGTIHDGVDVALCNGCGATWATVEQLEELHRGPVKTKVFPGATRHRCAICRLTLVRAKLDGRVDVELCSACRGVFFAEGALSKFKPLAQPLQASGRASMFTCVTCGKELPKSQGTARGNGLACRKCAGLEGQTPGYAPTDGMDRAVDWLSEDPNRPFRWVRNAVIWLGIGLVLIGAYCGLAP